MFYDPAKTFEDNFDNGPFFDSIPELERRAKPQFDFLGFPLYLPFGIAAGPLPTAKHVKAAFDWGFDVVNYKTQRNVPFKVNEFPHVVPVQAEGDISLDQAREGLVVADDFPADSSKIVITNSFGNPSKGPDFWSSDMTKASEAAGLGQVMIGGAVGTIQDGFSNTDYWQDFADAALLVKKTGAKIIEVNLSCPNVATEGVICYDKEAVVSICQRTKIAIGNTPLIIKLGYFDDSQQSLLEEIISEVDPYIDAVSAINTISAKVVKADGSQALPGQGRLYSGLCGAGIKWAGLDMVDRLADIRDASGYNYKIIGIGGVMTPEDFFAYREVGADLVQACTGPMWNPNLAHDIAQSMGI
jgi:dihydroorotate dehydrogenase (NAD+) catalytic subunit